MSNSQSFQVEDELNIYVAQMVWLEINEVLDNADRIEVDLGKVEEIDTAGVQILLALKAKAKKQNKTLDIVNHTPVVKEVIELLDLASVLGDPIFVTS